MEGSWYQWTLYTLYLNDMNEILVDIGFSESRVVLLEDGEIAEVYFERKDRESITGNIYMGKVINVLPGMHAAFVHIGLEKNAFLYFKDIYRKDKNSSNCPVKQGDEILVQVMKEPVGTKGAKVTSYITLPGKYIVLMPQTNYIGVSRKISDEKERNRLKELVKSVKPDGMGVIIRTEAEGRDEEEFTEDIKFLSGLWDRINKDSVNAAVPSLIHGDMDIMYRTMRDLMSRNTKRVLINEKNAYKSAVKYASLYLPEYKDRVKYFDSNIDIISSIGLNSKLEHILRRRVELKSGGYIIIDRTEALTCIDVNTGKYTGTTSNLKDTVLMTNMEAAEIIPRELRVRNIGGIVIVDFIDMVEENHRSMILNKLRDELKRDRIKSEVLGITQLGLVEIVRKKSGMDLYSSICKICSNCEGSGNVVKEETVVKKLERELKRVFNETGADSVLVELNENIYKYLCETKYDYIEYLKNEQNKDVFLKSSYSLDYSDIVIKSSGSREKIQKLMNPFEINDKVMLNIRKNKILNKSGRDNMFDGKIQDVIYDKNGNPRSLVINIDSFVDNK